MRDWITEGFIRVSDLFDNHGNNLYMLSKTVCPRRGHTTNSALHRETRKTYVARLQFYTPCDNILKVLLTEIP